MKNIVSCESYTYSVQLKETFKTALREINSFEVFQIKVTDSDGNTGAGECVATPAIVHDDFAQFGSIFDDHIKPLVLQGEFEKIKESAIWPSIKSALDCAIDDLTSKDLKVSVSTDVTLPVCEIDNVENLLRKRIDDGFSTFKVKLDSRELSANIELMVAINEIVGSQSRLRIDPNQAWEVAYALDFLAALKDQKIEIDYIEQPVKASNREGLRIIKSAGLYEVMADESCFSLVDAEELIRTNSCDWINIKLLKAGGITEARKVAALCQAEGMKFSVGSMLESPRGVRASILFAHEWAPEIVHDLDAAWWYATDEMYYGEGKVSLR